jgi:hypothetical protein
MPRRGGSSVFWVQRVVSELKISKPQYQVYDPFTMSVALVSGKFPSMRALSPGYCRTLIGLEDVPVNELVK